MKCRVIAAGTRLPEWVDQGFREYQKRLRTPLVLDLTLFFDLAQRAGLAGIQEWLSFYFKSPQAAAGLYPEHDLFIQHTKLKNTLRYLMGEEQITHLGVEYYEYGKE